MWISSRRMCWPTSATVISDRLVGHPCGQLHHAGNPDNTGGPAWVAAIVNAIGNQPTCPNGEVYRRNTAIFITWDDWGGWYDHEPPTILPLPQGDYQYGFRVC